LQQNEDQWRVNALENSVPSKVKISLERGRNFGCFGLRVPWHWLLAMHEQCLLPTRGREGGFISAPAVRSASVLSLQSTKWGSLDCISFATLLPTCVSGSRYIFYVLYNSDRGMPLNFYILYESTFPTKQWDQKHEYGFVHCLAWSWHPLNAAGIREGPWLQFKFKKHTYTCGNWNIATSSVY
jgi:hypothetical protein